MFAHPRVNIAGAGVFGGHQAVVAPAMVVAPAVPGVSRRHRPKATRPNGGPPRRTHCEAPLPLRRLMTDGNGRGRTRTGGEKLVLYWLLKYVVLGPWLRLIFRPQVEGREHVPDEGPAIIASNHLSFSDSIFMPLMVKRKVTFVAKAEYFTGKGLKGFLIQDVLRRHGARSRSTAPAGGRPRRPSTPACGCCARASCSASTRRAPVRPTAGCTAARPGSPGWPWRAALPVIPVAMLNADEIQPPGKVTAARSSASEIRFGPPLDFSRYAGMAGDRFIERAVTDEIMYELMTLSGREYVDVYAQKVKAQQAKAEPAPATQPAPTTRRPSGLGSQAALDAAPEAALSQRRSPARRLAGAVGQLRGPASQAARVTGRRRTPVAGGELGQFGADCGRRGRSPGRPQAPRPRRRGRASGRCGCRSSAYRSRRVEVAAAPRRCRSPRPRRAPRRPSQGRARPGVWCGTSRPSASRSDRRRRPAPSRAAACAAAADPFAAGDGAHPAPALAQLAQHRHRVGVLAEDRVAQRAVGQRGPAAAARSRSTAPSSAPARCPRPRRPRRRAAPASSRVRRGSAGPTRPSGVSQERVGDGEEPVPVAGEQRPHRVVGVVVDQAAAPGADDRPSLSSRSERSRSPSSRSAYATFWVARRRLGSWYVRQNSSASCRSTSPSGSPAW